MADDTKSELFKGKNIDELTGEDARRIIEELNDSKIENIPPSEKQMALIIRLADKNSVDLEPILSELGHSDLEELTGGRDGTASSVINTLIGIDKDSPATEKQVAAIKSMSENLEISIEDAMAIGEVTTIDEISKNEASGLIGTMKKMIQSRKRQQKK